MGALGQGGIILGHHHPIFDNAWNHYTFTCHGTHLHNTGWFILVVCHHDVMLLSPQACTHGASRPGSVAPPREETGGAGAGVLAEERASTPTAVGCLVPKTYEDVLYCNGAPMCAGYVAGGSQ